MLFRSGRLVPDDFSDAVAADPRIDALRACMQVSEDPAFTAASADPKVLASGNGIQVHFADGTSTPRIDVNFPAGHPSRNAEAAPLFRAKLEHGARNCYDPAQAGRILRLLGDRATFEQTTIDEFMGMLTLA